jgi:hypothetical protein
MLVEAPGYPGPAAPRSSENDTSRHFEFRMSLGTRQPLTRVGLIDRSRETTPVGRTVPPSEAVTLLKVVEAFVPTDVIATKQAD